MYILCKTLCFRHSSRARSVKTDLEAMTHDLTFLFRKIRSVKKCQSRLCASLKQACNGCGIRCSHKLRRPVQATLLA